MKSSELNIKGVGIIGAGQMGAGVAQVLATTGTSVIINDISSDSLKKALQNIEKSITKFHEKGKISEAPSAIMSRIRTTTEIEALADQDVVIEAINENENLKREIFQKLDSMLNPNAIIATNTSSLPITRLASYTKRPEKFIGMHFMNPVSLMTLVEIIRGHQTSQETYEIIKTLSEKMGKQTVCSNDYPGFIVNRILIPMINEAFYTLMEGVAVAEDIDTAMKLGTNQPMGPLALADFIGLDTCYSIMNVLYNGLGDSKYRPCPLLKRYVDAGLLGRKTTQGVYKY